MNSEKFNTTVIKIPCCFIGCNNKSTHVINPDIFEHETHCCQIHIENLKEDGLPNKVIPIEEWDMLSKSESEPEEDTKIHLCLTCVNDYPDCKVTDDDITFGNNVGNDNICKCKRFQDAIPF